MSFLNRITVMFHSENLDRDLDEELRSHIEMRTQDNLDSGMSPSEARRDAIRRFGNVARMKEDTRAARVVIWVETVLQDLRYALRQFRNSPEFAIVAVLTLALGIGANTAIFSLMNALILRQLPIREPSKLVRLSVRAPDTPNFDRTLSLAMYDQIRKNQQVFSDLFVWIGDGVINIEASGVKYVGPFSTVSGEFYRTLGIEAVLGRLITPDDLNLNSGSPAPVAVLSYTCWQGRYGGDSAVIGKTIWVENRPLTIVGVTPKTFSGLLIDVAPDVTAPIGYSGRTVYRDPKGAGLGHVFARLKEGVTIEQARAQVKSMWPAILAASLPEEYTGEQRDAFLHRYIVVTSASTGSSFLRERYTRPILILMAMATLLLVITCANLGNLMLVRAAARRQEFGIRVALGATKCRIIRQTLTESSLLSVTGAVLGVAIAYWASPVLLSTVWTGLFPLALDLTPDLRVLAFASLMSLGTALLLGISPARSILRVAPAGVLQQNGRTVRGRASSPGKALISLQVALSMVLVTGAMLFVRSLENLYTVDLGYCRDGVLFVKLYPRSGSEVQQIPNRAGYFRELAERLQGIPGVESVSYSHAGPLTYEYSQPTSVSSSQTSPAPALFEAVGPGFFDLIGMRLLAGRDFEWRDNDAAPRVVIVSESLSRRLFHSQNPIGRKIDFGDRKQLEIVGVVNSASLWMPQTRQPMAVYLPITQIPYNNPSLNIRVVGDPGSILPSTRAVIESLGRHVVLVAETLDQRSEKFLATDRIIAMLSSLFAGLALLLVSIGVYGLVSFAVIRRTSEIGVRMALGATRSRVIFLVLREAVLLIAAGLAAGVVLSLWAGRAASSLLFGIASNDPVTIAGAALLLAAVALVSSYIPARRAAALDPMVALRNE